MPYGEHRVGPPDDAVAGKFAANFLEGPARAGVVEVPNLRKFRRVKEILREPKAGIPALVVDGGKPSRRPDQGEDPSAAVTDRG